MELFANLSLGFSTALGVWPLVYCFCGVLLGTMVGVLPGLGPAATIAMLLPATFALSPELSLIMLAGIYYGAQYGGSTTAILINTPGEVSSVVTVLDGHRMAQQGRGGVALATAAIGSFIAGTFATLVIAVSAPVLARFAIRFGPSEYFALMVLGLVGAVVLASGSLLKAFGMVIVGLILGLAGTDVTSGTQRMGFGLNELSEGFNLVAVAMGMFGVAEVIRALGDKEGAPISAGLSSRLLPNRSEWRQIIGPISRGSVVGSVLGVLPGGGALLASVASYALEKKMAAAPERFGQGAIEGVAGPESANNAGAQTSFIPMLTLGLPTSPVMAMMIGAMMIQGIAPGPLVMSQKPTLFWGLIASMWLGNLMLLVLNLPLVGVWVRLLSMPFRFLFPAILMFCCIGAYTLTNSVFNVWVIAGAGLVGYLLGKLDCEPAPFILGFLLGPMMEENLQRALRLSGGDWKTFVTGPISITLLSVAGLLLLSTVVPSFRAQRQQLKET